MNISSSPSSLSLSFPESFAVDGQTQDKQLQEIIQSAPITLQTISVSHIKISQNALKSISVRRWPMLQVLQLAGVRLGNLGCKYLSLGQQWCIKLKQLMLNNNNIQAAGVQHLSKIKFEQLRQLWLLGNKLGNDAVRNLTKSKCLRLKTLYLDRNELTVFELVNLYILQCSNLQVCYIFENQIIKSEDYLWKLAVKKFSKIDQFYTY